MSNTTLFAKIRNGRRAKIICAFMALNILVELFSPTVAMALTAGPTSPEFTSFEPVATTDMVNDLTGDFTYNIPVLNVPGPDGSGYAMSLSYHSGSSSEEEASWVGFGWTLNPGAINRNKKGYPDEFNGVNVETYNKSKPNWTQSANFNVNVEISSKDGDTTTANKAKEEGGKAVKKMKTLFALDSAEKSNQDQYSEVLSVSYHHTVRYNNYSGFSIANGLGLGAKGMANLSLNRSGAQNTLGFSVNPSELLRNINGKKRKEANEAAKKTMTSETDKNEKKSDKSYKKSSLKFRNNFLKSSFPIQSFNVPALPYSVAKNVGASWNFNASMVLNPANFPLGGQFGFSGNLNIQAQEGYQAQTAYGYLNSYVSNTNTSDNVVYDYQLEKESTFSKNDKNLGIPYNNADVFSSSGNNVMGGFRFHHDQIGTYYPNFQTSETKIRQLGVELGLGSDVQIGLNVGVGKQTTKVKGKWPDANGGSPFIPQFSTTAPKMRFMNDMGGELDYDGNYNQINTGTISILGDLGTPSSNYSLTANPTKSKTSSDIEYVMSGNTITGVKITDKEGGKNNYTKPVYTRNEAELTIGLGSNQDGAYLATSTLYYDNPMKNPTAVGHKISEQYANSFLLESNTTFNYIDVNANNKCDAADFGGWTKFDYRQKYGALSGNWYRFRTPYNGLHYNPGRLNDLKDQTGSMSSGEKEVYYLKCIETKSHIAFFVTNATSLSDFPVADYPFLYDGNNNPLSHLIPLLLGSGTPRNDGLSAAAVSSGTDAAAASLTAKGSNSLEKLERIVLFAKSDLAKPLTTTYFEYDNSLCQGIPNSGAVSTDPSTAKGKLTLKRVWTESNGTARSQISPYIFTYEYFNNYGANLVSKYSWLTSYNNYPTNDPYQNPVYKPEQLDAWGNYQMNGGTRFANRQPWVYQGAQDPNFDPAAWQLKRIQLPSGGEIHIHYEQKDYTSVQDNKPMAMVSLLSDNVQNGYQSDESVYCINHSDLGIPNDGSISAYYTMLYDYFINQHNKLYFKVLYTFKGDDTPQLNTNNERYEYVSGYTSVNSLTVTSGKIFLQLGDVRENLLEPIAGEGKRDKTLPRYVCYQELLSNGGNNLGLNGGSYKSNDYTNAVYPGGLFAINQQDVVDAAKQNVLGNTADMFKDWTAGLVKNVKKKDACKSINFGLSYFKLPTYYAKKGGGIRVKRLLTYDKGISGETGDEMLFGSEYQYTGKDGRSSGVANNEPPEMREENALVGFMERKKQKFMDKITNGRDTKQFEGPLGENLLPGADVIHSRIIIKNIHSGKTTTGFAVNEYYTSKDFPMEVDYTAIKRKVGGGGTLKRFDLNLPLGLFNMDINRAWVTQGYLFKLNDMSGKILSKATYAGDYNPATFNESLATSKTTYNYSSPGAKISSLVYDKVNNQILRAYLNPGYEEDYTVFCSNVTERTCDFNFELDINITILALFGTYGANFSYTDQALRQHVTNKVVNQISYLLSTTNITDGVAQTTQNLAFDRYTGDPVLTRTFDGYTSPQGKIYTQNDGADKHQGFYYSLNIPASWMYSSMEPKSNNSSNTNQLTAIAGNVVTYGENSLYDNMITSTLSNVWSPVSDPLSNVVSGSATMYTNNWFAGTNSVLVTTYSAIPTVSAALNQFYYPQRSYSYRADVKNANTPSTGRIYEGGVISSNFKFFDWLGQQQTTPTAIPNEWYSDSRITKYSPYGYPIEEEDVLGIKSSASFGYNNVLPVAVAQNAGFNEYKFIDFEQANSASSVTVTTSAAHTGRASMDLSANQNYTFVPSYNVSSDMITKKGLSVKLWLRSSLSNNPSSSSYGLKNNNPKLKVKIGSYSFQMEALAQTGDWTLYSAEIKNFYGLIPGSYNIQLLYNYQTNESVYVDDFRIQPLDASMNCSVYYADNKLAAQFDDQHFAVIYEYDNRGQLSRKSIETTRGKKTLQEQQYNTPMINR